jgi:uncharacterized membrane protein
MAQTRPLDQAQQIANRIVVEDNIEVKAPIQQVYNRWNDFIRFPEFMRDVEEVRQLSGNRYHWVARIFGIREEWDAEITEREPERRISWRSTSGVQNAGTVSFSRLGPDKTAIRVRFEYMPPAGTFGKSLGQLTRPLKKAVKEDLKNFKQLLESKKMPSQQASMSQKVNQLLQQMPELGNQVPELLDHVNGRQTGNVLGALTIPVTAGVVGGLATYYLYKSTTRRFSLTNPSTWVSAPAANLTRFRMGAMQSPLVLRESTSAPAAIASWSLLGATAASILGAAGFRFANRRHEALFVGQWAPTLLGLSVLTRMVGNRNMRHDQTTTAISWGLLSACFGAIFASLFHRIRGKRHDSLFVGQWAPTFIGAALLARQLNRH